MTLKNTLTVAGPVLAALSFACTTGRMNTATQTSASSPAPAASAATPSIPLLAEWTGPFGGVPAFDKVRVADFKPALESAMAGSLAEIDRIANNPAPPTFQ